MKLYRYFEENGIPAYLPVVPDVKIHNVSYKDKSFRYENEVLRPMLKSYLFAQMTDAQKRVVWRTKSVCGVLNVTREQQSAFIGELRGLQVMEELAEYLKPFRCIRRVELLPYHKLGEFKWKELGLDIPFAALPLPSPEERNAAEALFSAWKW